MNRSVGHGCRFGLVTDHDGDVIFECPVYDADTRCPVEGCPGHADVRYCPVCGRVRSGTKIGDKAFLVCGNGHGTKMLVREWARRLEVLA